MKPEDILPDDVNQSSFDGVIARKGSIAAFLANARILLDSDATAAAREEAERDLRAVLPAVRAIGLFEICQVRDPALQALLDRTSASGK